MTVFPAARAFSAPVTRWFAFAAAAIVVTAAVGAHGMAWFARANRGPSIAVLRLDPATLGSPAPGSIDMGATGTVRHAPAGR